MQPDEPGGIVIVACLCAAWCGVCRDYQEPFNRLRTRFGAQARFIWVDIEDDAALMGGLDVEDFPTLLVALGPVPVFFGPLTPQPEVLDRLLRACLGGEPPPPVRDPEVLALVRRLTDRADA